VVDEPIDDRRLNALAQGGVDIFDAAVFQPFLCHLAVETTDIPGRQLLELTSPEFGNDVVLNIPSISVASGTAYGSFHAIREP
jgi:hypothetical protein